MQSCNYFRLWSSVIEFWPFISAFFVSTHISLQTCVIWVTSMSKWNSASTKTPDPSLWSSSWANGPNTARKVVEFDLCAYFAIFINRKSACFRLKFTHSKESWTARKGKGTIWSGASGWSARTGYDAGSASSTLRTDERDQQTSPSIYDQRRWLIVHFRLWIRPDVWLIIYCFTVLDTLNVVMGVDYGCL